MLTAISFRSVAALFHLTLRKFRAAVSTLVMALPFCWLSSTYAGDTVNLPKEKTCPSCVVLEKDNIEVVQVTNPAQFDLATLQKGFEAFSANRRFAPKAELQFMIQAVNPGRPLRSLTAVLEQDTEKTPIPLDANWTFTASTLLAAPTKAGAIVVNRQSGTLRVRPLILSAGTNEKIRRLGDLRLECEVTWALERESTSIFSRAAIGLVGGMCGSSKTKVSFRVQQRVKSALLIESGRSFEVPVDKTGFAFSPPIHDRTWSDEALVQLSFEDA